MAHRTSMLTPIMIALVLTINFFTSCSPDDTFNAVSMKYCRAPQALSELQTDSVRKIDWSKVAKADAENAVLGYELAKYSRNPYVMLAYALALGVSGSVDEYDRQMSEIDCRQISYETDLLKINPYHPIFPSTYSRAHFQGIADSLGLWHNAIISQHIMIEDNINRIDFESTYNEWYPICISFLHNSLVANEHPEMLNIDYGVVYSNFIQMSEDEQREIIDSVDSIISQPFLEGFCYVNEHIDELDLYTIAHTINYYSQCLWHTIAPNPYVVDECLIYNFDLHELVYVDGRSDIDDIGTIMGVDDITMYPSYGTTEAVTLYIYNTEEHPFDINVHSSIVFEQDCQYISNTFDGVSINIHEGEYVVHTTDYEDVFYIEL